MKVLGIGIDLCKNARMQKILENPKIKDRFLNKVLHSNENIPNMSANYLASRWAAKEALVKALACKQILFHEIQLCKHPNGQPFIEFYGKTKELIEKQGVEETMTSLSHEDEYSVAVVIAMGKQPTHASN